MHDAQLQCESVKVMVGSDAGPNLIQKASFCLARPCSPPFPPPFAAPRRRERHISISLFADLAFGVPSLEVVLGLHLPADNTCYGLWNIHHTKA